MQLTFRKKVTYDHLINFRDPKHNYPDASHTFDIIDLDHKNAILSF